jgi:hypothetical protein
MGELTDKEILLIVADHLIGKASIWFEVMASNLKSWNEFVNLFKSTALGWKTSGGIKSIT